jgi:hypothetical protein
MFNVCPACGIYNVEKAIDPAGPYAVCPACGYAHPFRQLPLFVVAGASGSGKTATGLALVGRLAECVVLDCDILWRPEFNTPADDYQAFRATWLNLAKNIGQSGRPVVLFGSAGPAQLEGQAERRYFSMLHYLALVCDPAILIARLQARPAWRASAAPEFMQAMQQFNRRLREMAPTTSPPMTVLDTTDGTPSTTADAVAAWVRNRLAG